MVQVKTTVVIVALLLCELVLWTLCDEHGCYECEHVLNRVSPMDHCPITMKDCGQCLDGYVMDTRNVSCFQFEWIQWPCAVVMSVDEGDTVNLIYTVNAEVSCEWLKDGHVMEEDIEWRQVVMSVRGYPPPSRWLDCTLTLVNVSQGDLDGEYSLRIHHHLTPFAHFTRSHSPVTIRLNAVAPTDSGISLTAWEIQLVSYVIVGCSVPIALFWCWICHIHGCVRCDCLKRRPRPVDSPSVDHSHTVDAELGSGPVQASTNHLQLKLKLRNAVFRVFH